MQGNAHKSNPSSSASEPRHPSRDFFRAIAQHEDRLGDDPELVAPRRGAAPRWPQAARVGAGLAASAVTTPIIYLLVDPPAHIFLPVALVTALTGVLGAYASYSITRREINSWVTRLVTRTDRLFRGESTPETNGNGDFETHLESLARRLELSLENQLRSERDALLSTITSLVSALEARDPYTRNHSSRVAQLAVRLGRQMGLDTEELYELHLAGLLHDIGKIGIPDAILLKPAGLTRDEYEIMKTHPVLGARILSGIPGLEPVADTVLHHHEMFDGGGYPDRVAGTDIPLGARIIAVCDTYLSMAEDRPYRKGRTLDQIVQELRRVAGKQHDPDVVDAILVMTSREMEMFGSPLVGQLAAGETEEFGQRGAA